MEKNGAGTRSRTPDLLITSQLLYQLSYAGIFIFIFSRFSGQPLRLILRLDRLFLKARILVSLPDIGKQFTPIMGTVGAFGQYLFLHHPYPAGYTDCFC